MFGASKTASGSNLGPSDPYYEYVTMLLTGDGTNGAQNNTFVDSSTNNFTITRNGNTTQGSFSPYGTNWGVNFNTTGSYLSFPSSSAFVLDGDFTIECWINPSNLPTTTSGSPAYPRIFSFGTYDAANSFGLEINSNENNYVRRLVCWYNGSLYSVSNNNAVGVGSWYHIAVVRSGTTITTYINGVSTGSTITGASASINRSQPFYIATLQSYESDANAQFNGSISNFRIIKGTALYTSNFTPSTTPLTAVSGTTLLTCQSNRFIDNSSTASTATSYGNASVQRFSPFNPTVPYSTATIGGSGYFDGTGDYLNTPATSALEFGSGDFTLECWVYPTTSARMALYHGSSGTDWSIGVDFQSQKFCIWASSNGSSWNLINADGGGNGVGTITVPLNAWTHFAYVRSGTTWQTYINGVRDLNLTGISGSLVDRSSSAKSIGKWWFSDGIGDPGPWTGEIANFRIVKGTAVYTSAFTPPTSPLTAITNTALLLNMTNAGIPDSAMMNDLETAGNAQVSTSVKKYGTGSLSFDGTGDYLKNVNGLPFNSLGSGQFTVEMWIYRNGNGSGGTSDYDAIIGTNNGAAAVWGIYVQRSTSKIGFYNSAGLFLTSSTISSTTWTHIAVSRDSSNNLQIFINGTSGYSASNTGTGTAVSPLYIAFDGTTPSGNNAFNGYIDDLRITKGYARYTANFTPPTTALPTY